MKIYFCGSITAGRGDAELYHRLIERLQKYGQVLTEYVGNTTQCEEFEAAMDDKEIYAMTMALLKEADVLVAEVTCVSMGVGFELGRAVGLGKKILCLFRHPEKNPQKFISAMVSGAHDGKNFIVQQYTEPEVDEIFKQFFAKTT